MQAALMPAPFGAGITSEQALVGLALALGAAAQGGPLSPAEKSLCAHAVAEPEVRQRLLNSTASAIREGGDPLGEVLCSLRSGSERRQQGVFYTPPTIVRSMVDWLLDQSPSRVVDPGCGSGRFSAAVIRQLPDVELLAVDLDPLQTLIARATLAVLGARNARVLHANYLEAELPRTDGRTAFISNPPYVRHHDLSPETKAWGGKTAAKLGHRFSALAGLHAHFFLATAQLGRTGDVGCFVTSAEWLDVGYGSVIRSLLLNGLGGRALHVVDPSTAAFDDAQTTAVITCFHLGLEPKTLRVRRVASAAELRCLDIGDPIPRAEFAKSARWSPLTKEVGASDESSLLLGDFVAVHRGMVTGANDYFVMTHECASALGISQWCVPVISDGKEILESDGIIRKSPGRKVLLRVPKDIERSAYPALDAYLRLGELPAGDPRTVANRYISSHRRPWWYLGAQEPPPIVASYMARQPPVFALNTDGLALINIAHGLYPKRPMTEDELQNLVSRLNNARENFRGRGRTYQGGLEKFEPREMEALPVAFSSGA